MSIPKLNGIAAIMYGWHYLHVLVVLYFFSEDGGPSGEKLRRFSLDTPVSRQLRGRQLLLRGRYVQIDFMYRVILSHTYTCTMPPKAPELKEGQLAADQILNFLKKIKMFKDYQLYKVYKIPQKQNKKERNIFSYIYNHFLFSSEVLDPEVVK